MAVIATYNFLSTLTQGFTLIDFPKSRPIVVCSERQLKPICTEDLKWHGMHLACDISVDLVFVTT